MTNASKNQSNAPSPKPVGNACRVCKQPIALGAKKCIHCESFQDWRRYLNLSSTVLALIVALVSVLSISFPIIKESFQIDNSNITILYQSASDEFLTFIGSNSGKFPGGIGNVSLTIQGEIWQKRGVLKGGGVDWTGVNIEEIRAFNLDVFEHDTEAWTLSPFFLSGESTQLIVGKDMLSDLITKLYGRFLIHSLARSKMNGLVGFGPVEEKSRIAKDRYDVLINSPATCLFTFQIINFDSTIEEQEINLDCSVISEYLNYDASKLSLEDLPIR